MRNRTISLRCKGNFWLIRGLMIVFLAIISSNVRHSYLLQWDSLNKPYREKNRGVQSSNNCYSNKRQSVAAGSVSTSLRSGTQSFVREKKKERVKKRKCHVHRATKEANLRTSPAVLIICRQIFSAVAKTLTLRDRWKKKCYHSINCCGESRRRRYQSHTCDFSAFQKVKPPFRQSAGEGCNKDHFALNES